MLYYPELFVSWRLDSFSSAVFPEISPKAKLPFFIFKAFLAALIAKQHRPSEERSALLLILMRIGLVNYKLVAANQCTAVQLPTLIKRKILTN